MDRHPSFTFPLYAAFIFVPSNCLPTKFKNISKFSKQGKMATIATAGAGPECLPFNPKGSKIWVADHFNNFPRYLFRLYAPESWGETNEMRVVSRAARSFRKVAFFSMPAEEAANVLNKHLWWDWAECPHDNLM